MAGGAVLGAWAFLFWFLQLTGRVNLYLSTRTSWVVPVGAGLLTLAALGRIASARTPRTEPLRRREAMVMALMVLPVVVVLALPTATLGTFSASKKSTFSSSSFSSIYGQITADSPITLLSIASAQTSTEGADALAKRFGAPVDLVGFVTRFADTPADEFLLTRYVITCCVADTTIVQVHVVNVVAGVVEANDWVEVKGLVYPIGREVYLDATSVVEVPRPDKPYLTP
ncbi:MAG TPA: TIGR03943 family protein [Actinomycetota bacterium]|nr:TIGR03943 family protein [Actinomycetota bacterium]